MYKTKMIFNIFLIICLSIFILSCSTQKSKYGTTYDDIHHEIIASLINNKVKHSHVKRTSRFVPTEVKNALLPSFDFSNRIPAERRFDVTADEIPAKTFFMGLVTGTSINMLVNPEVTGNITLNLKNVSLDEVLSAVHDAYGYIYKKTTYGYEILPRKLETALFNVNYLDVKRTGKSVTSLSTDQVSDKISSSSTGTTGLGLTGSQVSSTTTESSGSSIKTDSEMDFWKELKNTLITMIGDANGRSILVNPEAGIVAIRAFPDELEEVAHYLARIQSHMGRQVILEAKILEVQLNHNFQAGINWNAFGLGFPSGGGASQSGTATFETTDMQDFNSIFTLNVGKGSFNALIKLLQTQGNVQVLSSPRISTINNQKAVIKVGSDEFFVTGLSTQNTVTSSTTTVPTQDVNLTPFFSGITFDVTPEISGNDIVTLHIHPAVSVVTQKDKNIVLGQTTNNTNNTLTLPLAFSTIRESDNVVRARNGQVIVIGGLMTSNMTEEIAGVPVVSRLPFVGSLFRRTYQVSGKSELVILLRPIIISQNTFNNDIETTSHHFEKLKRPFHVGGFSDVYGNEAERKQL